MDTKKILSLLTAICMTLFLCSCKTKKEARIFDPSEYEYHNGVAWVQLEKKHLLSTEYLGVVCIDENGIEVFSMPEINGNQVSNYCNEVALVDGRYIIDKTGHFIHDLKEELAIDKVVMFNNRYFDGFIFVQKNVNGVAMTGMLNTDLEWIIQPTSKFNNIEPKDNCLYYNSAIGFYDAKTNEFIDEGEYKSRHIQRCFPDSGLIFLKKVGHSGNYSLAYSAGSVSGTIKLNETCQTGFYDHSLQMILDLGCYPDIEPLSDFRDEKCLVQFDAPDNSTYVGLINLEGEFLFFRVGYIGYDDDRIEFQDCYFDWDGNCYIKETETSD